MREESIEAKVFKRLETLKQFKIRSLQSYISVLLIFRRLYVTCFCWLGLKKTKRTVAVRVWIGRLGNNLIQIATAEWFARRTGATLSLPPHRFLPLQKYEEISGLGFHEKKVKFLQKEKEALLTREWSLRRLERVAHELEKDLAFCTKNILNSSFFWGYDYFGSQQPSVLDYRKILRSLSAELFENIERVSVPENTLVIHLRSGDIFKNGPNCGEFVQPPLAFYEEIIERGQYSEIILASTADLLNPCIQALLEKYPQARVQSRSLSEDAALLLSAPNLAIAMSSFSLALAMCSDRLKRLFVPAFVEHTNVARYLTSVRSNLFRVYDAKIPLGSRLNRAAELDFEVRRLHLPGYIPVGKWQANPYQLDRLLSYPRGRITVESP